MVSLEVKRRAAENDRHPGGGIAQMRYSGCNKKGFWNKIRIIIIIADTSEVTDSLRSANSARSGRDAVFRTAGRVSLCALESDYQGHNVVRPEVIFR